MTPPEKKPEDIPPKKHSASTPPPSNGLHIEELLPDAIFLPPKSTL